VGGDEFAVVAPGSDQERCLALAEHIRRAISTSQFDTTAPLTVSVGVAVYPQHGTEREDLIRSADFAMYRSKEDGKNRVTLYDQSLEVPSRLAWRVLESKQYMNAVSAVAAR
jgi:diguanylate cyclase (GGDEF)-like protein